jgi:hypothetical protein
VQNVGEAATVKPPLTGRLKFGIGLTALSVVILVFPGGLALPVYALIAFLPRPGGCAASGAAIVFVAFLVAGLVLSGLLIAFGIATVVLTALRKRTSLVAAVLFNAIVVSLLVLAPLGYPTSSDSARLGVYVTLAICAVIPVTALVLLLSPAAFSSWFHSRGPFVVTCVLVGLLLLPGPVGLVSLGGPVHDLFFAQHAASVSPHSC